jgi:hypothetical protein
MSAERLLTCHRKSDLGSGSLSGSVKRPPDRRQPWGRSSWGGRVASWAAGVGGPPSADVEEVAWVVSFLSR